MIAEVYPIMKLPRRCTVFDYHVPPGLQLHVGDLVRVPFKHREEFAIVRTLKTESTAGKLSHLNAIAKTGYLTEADIIRYETIAQHIAQSVSSLLYAALPTVFTEGRPPQVQATQTSRVNTGDIPILEKCFRYIATQASVAISGDRDIGFALAYILRRKMLGQVLILLPRERDAELLAKSITFPETTALLHGKISLTDRAKIIEAWRIGKLQTLISTRIASLLPAQALTAVLILEAGNNEHINERRNPRFDAREAAKLLAKQHQAKYITFDALPRLEDTLTSTLVNTLDLTDPSVVINLGSADEITAVPLLSNTVLLGIERALQNQKKVLLLLNRKGVAKRLQCSKCGHIPLCGTCGQVPNVRHEDLICAHCQTEMWIPANCPACSSAKLGLRGIGGAKVASALQELFPHASLGTIEKGNLTNPEADIVVVTEYYFSSYREPFDQKRFGLIADLAADISLHASSFRGAEETARKLQRLIAFAKRHQAEVYIQTWLPDILKTMLNLSEFVQSELELRKRYQLPPYAARLILHNATPGNLPPELQAIARERTDVIELTVTTDTPISSLRNLPDSIKLHYDGPYV